MFNLFIVVCLIILVVCIFWHYFVYALTDIIVPDYIAKKEILKCKEHICSNCKYFNENELNCYIPLTNEWKTKGYFNKCYFNAYKKIQEYYYPVRVYFDDTLLGHERELWIHDFDKENEQIRFNSQMINNIISIFGKDKVVKEIDKVELYLKGNIDDNKEHKCKSFNKKHEGVFSKWIF